MTHEKEPSAAEDFEPTSDDGEAGGSTPRHFGLDALELTDELNVDDDEMALFLTMGC